MRGGMFAGILGAGLLFAAPQAMAQDTEAPCPIFEMGTFIAYFWPQPDSLNTDALGVIKAVADYYIASQSSTGRCSWRFEGISLVGHTDTAGDDAVNLSLSRHRAELVADELVRLGIPREVISIDAKGESQPAVSTGDGVQEPLNNRVTIDPM